MNAPPSTSESLLYRLRSPQADEAWARFVELYAPLLDRWARQRACPEHQVADLVQEVLTLLVQKLPGLSYQPGQSFAAWLRTVAHNCWNNLQRRAKLPIDARADPQEVAGVEADPFWEVEYRQQLFGRALTLMQSEFAPSTWQACLACVVHGKSAAQAAQELGLSPGAVYVARSRVLSRLRQELAGLWE